MSTRRSAWPKRMRLLASVELRASGIARRRAEEEGAEAFFPLRATTK